MIDVYALQSRVTDLGRLGENQHRRVVFDVAGYIKQYPDATFTVLNRLPNETTAYLVPNVTRDGDNVYWAVTSADLAKTGDGRCELLVMQGETIAKSVIYLTRVGEALDGSGEVPDEWESWQTVFAGLKDEAVTAADEAQSAAQAVQDMGATAETTAPGSEATVEKYVDEHGAVTLAFGIPRGDKGETGDTGATPDLTIGTVETLEPGEDATATITGTPENPMLNLGIPRGEQGPKGDPGDPGDLSGKADVIITSASGNPASFSDGANGAKMTSLVVGIEPVQAGSGDPSPDNVRPISGWTGLTLNHSGADTSNPDTLSISWESEAGTVYGGSLDVASGVLTVDRAMIDLGTLTWGYYSQYASFVAPVNGKIPYVNNQYDYGIMSSSFRAVNIWWTKSSKPDKTMSCGAQTNICIKHTGFTNAAEFKAAVSGVQLVYQLATPITYQLEPHEVTTLLGDNNIWADTGDVAATYRADTKRYIDAKIAKAIEEAMQA